MQDEALIVVDVGCPPDEPQAVHEGKALLFAAQSERQNPAEPMRELSLRGFVVPGAGQSWIVHCTDLFVATLQVLCNGQRIFAALLCAEAQGFESKRLQVCIVGRE